MYGVLPLGGVGGKAAAWGLGYKLRRLGLRLWALPPGISKTAPRELGVCEGKRVVIYEG